MNLVYFACQTCRTYIDAGYRHAYWTLEEVGVVQRGRRVDVDAVRKADEFWAGALEAKWLSELLPRVREFLAIHEHHEVVYGDDDEARIPVNTADQFPFFDWLQEAGFVMEELPRYWVERLGYVSWNQVVQRMEEPAHRPIWWQDAVEREAARRKFNSLVVARTVQ